MKVEEEVIDILVGLASGRLKSVEVTHYDLNKDEERKEFKEFVAYIRETYKEIVRKTTDDGEIVLYENTTVHTPSPVVPTWVLIEEVANDTGDWTATIYAIF